MEMEGFVDYRGRPISRSATGGWASARYIMVEEVAERFAFVGVYSNLVTFLTGRLGMSTAAAAANVNAWYGTSGLLPSVMGLAADAYVGRFRMVAFSALLYILTLFLLAAVCSLPSLQPPASPSRSEVALVFFVLYAMTVAQGGHKPCIQALGADQFDGSDPAESKRKSSFFNWWYVAMYVGNLAGILVLNYVQENAGWVLGFGLPGVAMSASLVVFLLGTKRYRNHVLDSSSPGAQMARNIRRRWSSFWKTRAFRAMDPLLRGKECSEQGEANDSTYDGGGGGAIQGVTGKTFLPLLPIWATCLVYAVIFAQPPTLFTRQGSTLDRALTPTTQVPAAALQGFICVTIAVFVPVYDRLLVPLLRGLTTHPSGLSTLQRVGAGIALSSLCMAVAALVESRRLAVEVAVAGGGGGAPPDRPLPMSLWWLVPQYVLFGAAESLTNVGLLEFFYDEMPRGLRGFGLGLYLGVFGIGSFLSSFLISVLDGFTDWFADDPGRGHLDYFYWLLAGLSAAELVIFLFYARSYVYRKI